MEDQWAIVLVLENRETSVLHDKFMVEVKTHQECQEFIRQFKPNTFGYVTDEAKLLDEIVLPPEAINEPGVIKAVSCRAVPRTEYDPQKHDTMRLKNGSCIESFISSGNDFAKRVGLIVDEQNIGSALDVMASLATITPEKVRMFTSGLTADGYADIRQYLVRAYPFVWKPHMVKIAGEAIGQLKEAIPATTDLLPLNPSLWLYCGVGGIIFPAGECLYPMHSDGHMPWPDELVVDVGRFLIADLLVVKSEKLVILSAYLESGDDQWQLRYIERLCQLGQVPDDPWEQRLLKMLLFVQSPYLVWRPERPRRAFLRRSMGRFPVAEKLINVILLRRIEALEKRPSRETGEPVEWSWQWWVSGHWRRQWHPSLQRHKPVWIAPYIKGPPDKPLKQAIRLIVR